MLELPNSSTQLVFAFDGISLNDLAAS